MLCVVVIVVTVVGQPGSIYEVWVVLVVGQTSLASQANLTVMVNDGHEHFTSGTTHWNKVNITHIVICLI